MIGIAIYSGSANVIVDRNGLFLNGICSLAQHSHAVAIRQIDVVSLYQLMDAITTGFTAYGMI